MPQVAGFTPATSGFQFPNRFPHAPLQVVSFDFLGLSLHQDLGDISGGLCGGMVFAVRDYFDAGLVPPQDPTAPNAGPLLDYLKRRLIASWDGAPGILRYLWYMNPAFPDHDTLAFGHLVARGRYSNMVHNEWPLVKADIDNGYLSPLGLIKTKSAQPGQLVENHQVLAYRYDLTGPTLTDLTLYFYDPNAPGDNAAQLSLNLSDPSQSCNLACTSPPVLYCFFRGSYSPPPSTDPPPGGTPFR